MVLPRDMDVRAVVMVVAVRDCRLGPVLPRRSSVDRVARFATEPVYIVCAQKYTIYATVSYKIADEVKYKWHNKMTMRNMQCNRQVREDLICKDSEPKKKRRVTSLQQQHVILPEMQRLGLRGMHMRPMPLRERQQTEMIGKCCKRTRKSTSDGCNKVGGVRSRL